MKSQLGDVFAVEDDLSDCLVLIFCQLEYSEQAEGQSGLATAGAAHDTDLFLGLYVECDLFDD